MTRINAGIPPQKLSNKHLLAEHREIKRIPNVVAKGKANMEGIPAEFTLGKGHVKFFYDKQEYLFTRYLQIYQECKRRGFNVQRYGRAWDPLKQTNVWNRWKPTVEARSLVAERINTRLDIHKSMGMLDWHSLID